MNGSSPEVPNSLTLFRSSYVCESEGGGGEKESCMNYIGVYVQCTCHVIIGVSLIEPHKLKLCHRCTLHNYL